MNITKNIDYFIEQQVDSKTCNSVKEAEEKIRARLFERQLDSKILRAREDIKAGRVRKANSENNARFLATLEKELLSNQA